MGRRGSRSVEDCGEDCVREQKVQVLWRFSFVFVFIFGLSVITLQTEKMRLHSAHEHFAPTLNYKYGITPLTENTSPQCSRALRPDIKLQVRHHTAD
jgi:hypothetical protein